MSLTKAAQDVLAERERQKSAEGWTEAHDDAHQQEALSMAGADYALFAFDQSMLNGEPPILWPWDKKWWKPKDPRRNLVRAAALIIAEIERLDRATPTKEE